MKKIIFILALFILTSNIIYAQGMCDLLGFPISTHYAKEFLEYQNLKYKNDEYKDTSVVDTFRVIDICKMKNIYLLLLQLKSDTLGYKIVEFNKMELMFPTTFLVISLEENESCCTTKMKIGEYYRLKIDPYFPISRLPGDFMYPILLGKNKTEAIELQFLSHGNVYTSPQINGIYYCTQ